MMLDSSLEVDKYYQSIKERYKYELERIGQIMIAGELTEDCFFKWHNQLDLVERFAIRRIILSKYSYFVFTKEWIASMSRALMCIGIDPGNVLEVFAGWGYLGKLMGWKCVDIEPLTPWVVRMDALEAANVLSCGAIFAGWVPLGSSLDLEIAQLGKPMVVVGEWPGGCTGSDELGDWEGLRTAKDRYEWFVDVPTWEGIWDCTMLINWPT